ncbi:hypothetical protein RHGRI_008063 [Rhododendron griersonianum]|uniref:Pentatricopeptide repeat-containing protein n=1 Tax=Rhododendron griersonianum TaxID=479676 RepID=A0AAV6KYX1_9ERIC|nr:hypothetical protein RHGRI_008063 [Rhododendron griersonianum]
MKSQQAGGPKPNSWHCKAGRLGSVLGQAKENDWPAPMSVRLMPRLQRTMAPQSLQPRGLAETLTGSPLYMAPEMWKGIEEVDRAEEFFREMGLSGVECACVTFEHLINGYCQIGEVDSAMMLYKDMCRKGFRLESSTVDAVIRGLGGENRVSQALEFLGVAIRKHELAPKRKSYEILIKGLCQEGRMEEALKLQAEMVGKGCEPNCEIYSSFIEANTKEGNDELAEMLKEMFETQMPKEEE